MTNNKQSWHTVLICSILCPTLLFLGANSTPIQPQTRRARDRAHTNCAHDSIAELIKKSPVILKALGAHIFTDDGRYIYNYGDELFTDADISGVRTDDGVQHQLLHDMPTFIRSVLSQTTTPPVNKDGFALPRSTQSTISSSTQTSTLTSTAANPAAVPESILITLTPETVYKGASLLKMTPSAENMAGGEGGFDGGSSGSRSSNFLGSSDLGNAPEDSSFQYEGQLNATLKPLSCFDENLLQILPTELIVFGKLVTMQRRQEQFKMQMEAKQQHTAQPMDILFISINGLHRWSPQFENHIWKHLGWDDWSDFTLCSVTCGKGVQQRFRRCLLDNPMVNLKMQLNLDMTDDDDGDDTDEDETGVEEVEIITYNDEATTTKNIQTTSKALNLNVNINDAKRKSGGKRKQSIRQDETVNFYSHNDNDWVNTPHKSNLRKAISAPTVAVATTKTKTVRNDDGEMMRIFEGNLSNNNIENDSMPDARPTSGGNRFGNSIEESSKKLKDTTHHKRRKSIKNYSTMFCEGYNIEQRNCNTFECSDDISDLLKFYKKFSLAEDIASTANVAATVVATSTFTVESPSTTTIPLVTDGGATYATTEASMTGTLLTTTPMTADLAATAASSGISKSETDSGSISVGGRRIATGGGDGVVHATGAISDDAAGAGSTNANVAGSATVASTSPATTPANMGFISTWCNPLNFTIMLTLRVRNDSKSASTIFSIRNATHNLYLESCKDGLRIYLERDSTTEMLPVKFNLCDYRWHQVAISIQNGDFISIYVDCSWSNSFVVSKRLYTLPLDADIEIGRGFKGELQQLLILPNNQERQQCSNRRTSINEVKRYIIDTFIDDYGN